MWNAINTVFGKKRWAICATVEQSYTVFFKLSDLHISTSVPATLKRTPVRRTGAYSRKMVANTVANVVAALLTYRLPTMLVQFMTQFPRYFIE